MPENFNPGPKEKKKKTDDNYSFYIKHPVSGMNETCFKSERKE